MQYVNSSDNEESHKIKVIINEILHFVQYDKKIIKSIVLNKLIT